MDDLEDRLDELLLLLDECGERYWHRRMSMARAGVVANRLGGVSQVLGAYGGEDTFSDLELRPELRATDPQRHLLLNRRLEHLRNILFRLANSISNATARGDGAH